MLSVEFSLSILNLIAIVFGSLLTGYLFRRRQLHKKQFKISELRKEIVYNHAQILELQKEYVTLEKTMNKTIAPVLPMKSAHAEAKEAIL
jgi:predicted nucleotide-binding protein (sugar kinase/HSP70/actin superfamily)